MISPVKRVSVVGLGYIGLPTAAMFASRKVEVIGVDVNEHAVETINKGQIHITEPDLDMVVSAAVNQGFLRATTTPEPADAFLIAVPTPFKDNNIPDLSYIEAAAKAIAPVLEKGNHPRKHLAGDNNREDRRLAGNRPPGSELPANRWRFCRYQHCLLPRAGAARQGDARADQQ